MYIQIAVFICSGTYCVIWQKPLLVQASNIGHKSLMLSMQMGVANRDIKLENTLLMDTSDKPVLKLCDFGYSKDELCASISKTMCGESLHVNLKRYAACQSNAMGHKYVACIMCAILCLDTMHA